MVSQVHPAGQLLPQSILPLQPSPIRPQYDLHAVAAVAATQASTGPASGMFRNSPPVPALAPPSLPPTFPPSTVPPSAVPAHPPAPLAETFAELQAPPAASTRES